MPEDTALTIKLGGNLSFLHSLTDSKVLVITCQDLNRLLTVAGEENKVPQNIQQSVSLEDALIESIKLRKCCIFVVAVLSLPLHETIQARSNGTSLVSGKIADYADGIVYKHGGNVLHIVADLIIGVLYTSFFL